MATNKLADIQKKIADEEKASQERLAKLKQEMEALKAQGLADAKKEIADLEDAQKAEVKALLDKHKQAIKKHIDQSGYTPTELGLRSARGTAGKKPAPKRTRLPDSAKPYLSGVTYNHPNPGPGDKKTYVGGSRGRVPGWLLDEVKKNGNADALAVKDAAFAAMSKVRADEQKARGSV